MKKTISIFLLMCFSLSLMGMASAETGSNEATIKGQILAYTEDWFTDNFSEHYDISDYEASVNNFQQSGAEIYAEIAACAVTTLKYNSVEELPYMEGIKDSLQINSLAEVIPVEYVTQQSAIAASELQKSVEFATSQSTTRLSLDANTQRSILTPQMVAENIVDSLDMPITEAQAANLSTHIADAYVDAAECIGVGTVLTMDLIFGATYVDGTLSQITLLESHDGNATANATALIPQTTNQMRAQARTDISNYLSSESSQMPSARTRGLSTYDRIAARNYAWEHTYPGYGVNTNNPDEDGWLAPNNCGHGYYVDRNYWNDTDYPIDTCLAWGHCHNDCACFVSQCLVAGGIPTTEGQDGWEFPTDGDPTYAWHNTGGLKTYMTNNGYWDNSTFAACNAGNVVYTDSGHVTLCTLNDTITRRYTAHTNDRNNKIYSSAYEYYVINTN